MDIYDMMEVGESKNLSYFSKKYTELFGDALDVGKARCSEIRDAGNIYDVDSCKPRRPFKELKG